MLFIKLYAGQKIRVEKQTIRVKEINWETHPENDGFATLTISEEGKDTQTVTLPMRSETLILECYATLCATSISKHNDNLQVQLALHSEVMLDIEFP